MENDQQLVIGYQLWCWWKRRNRLHM